MNSRTRVTAHPTLGGSLHVLVVDDDPTIRHVHTAILRRAGFQVTTVEDGADALAAIDRGDVQLVLLDSRMPGMSGTEVLTQIRDQGLSTPVVLVTGAADTRDRVEGLERGADDYITKPVEPRELIARVQALLRGRQAAVDEATGASVSDGARRAEIEAILDRSAFTPVFQPIVALASRRVVAYEALTRFVDGTRPDLRFAEAARVGLGDDLALATLGASIIAARDLPDDAALHLNVAPALLENDRLARLLATADRPVVVELTEHDPIDDYERAVHLLASLGDGVRLAVDDAGAGFSSMNHILALNPQEVKLDREWVRGVDQDLARTALIAGLVTFATATGTVLVAEGVETEAEARALSDLGVGHAQGFHLGRPRTSDAWKERAFRAPASSDR